MLDSRKGEVYCDMRHTYRKAASHLNLLHDIPEQGVDQKKLSHD